MEDTRTLDEKITDSLSEVIKAVCDNPRFVISRDEEGKQEISPDSVVIHDVKNGVWIAITA